MWQTVLHENVTYNNLLKIVHIIKKKIKIIHGEKKDKIKIYVYIKKSILKISHSLPKKLKN